MCGRLDGFLQPLAVNHEVILYSSCFKYYVASTLFNSTWEEVYFPSDTLRLHPAHITVANKTKNKQYSENNYNYKSISDNNINYPTPWKHVLLKKLVVAYVGEKFPKVRSSFKLINVRSLFCSSCQNFESSFC